MRKDGEIVIRPGATAENYWRELWIYRELFVFFAWRDITVRYKQTALGVLWALIQPLVTMLVLTFVFGRLAGMPSHGVPYPVLVYAGVLPWQLFATSLTNCSGSLVANANLLRKIFFPRLIIPASTMMVGLVDFAVALSILVVLMAWFQVVPGIEVLALPLFLAAAFVTALSAGVWFAALNVKYRDFRYLVPFVVQLGVYVSPVGFSTNAVPESYRFLYALNPMASVINGFRWSLLGGDFSVDWGAFAASMALVLALLYTGVRYFRSVENSFADVV